MNNNWRPWAAIAIFFSSYLPLSLVLLIQDINSEAVSRVTFPKVVALIKLFPNDFWSAVQSIALGLLRLFHNPGVSLAITACCFASVFVLKFAVGSLSGGENVKILKSLKNPTDLMNYTVPYMVAFIGVDLGDGPKVAGFVCFMLFMFILTYKSKQLFMNPILAIFGYSLYDVDYEHNSCPRSARILAKNDLVPGKRYRLRMVASLPIITQEIPIGDNNK
ncbi:hypothetical protein [Desulfocurvus sp. DL9XJH121]